MTYDEIRTMAGQFSGVEESVSYGTPALKVAGKWLVRLREDGETVVLYCDMEERAVLMQADPETFYITEHYRNWPAVLVRLDTADAGAFQDAFERSWRARAPKKLVAFKKARV